MARGDVLAEHEKERLALRGRYEEEALARREHIHTQIIAAVRALSDEDFREAYKVWRAEYMRRWRARRRGDG